MKIGLLGSGRMGKEVERLASTLGDEICVRFDLGSALKADSDVAGASVLIDFSSADAVVANLTAAAALSLPVVEGTTGWLAQLERVRTIPGLTMVYSSNFSMGVYRFLQLVKTAGRLYGVEAQYDVYIHEWHHRGKADSPSGTAMTLAQALLEVLPQKTELLTTASSGEIPAHTLHVSSTRVGRVPGTHEVGFDSAFDQITLRHQAFGREAFAYGALQAAHWIVDRRGMYTMDDFMAGQS
ncbi:4-hydroxy-tetrahydrodipicolinate reductase [bacterium]|nr:4-hydroxy-tetrahydrodipicolinate reductase [bacterium]